VLQFIFILLIFIIFSIFLVSSLSYHYALYFKFDKNLRYKLAVSVIFLQLIFRADADGHLLLLKIFNFEKELNLNKKNKLINFIEAKSKKEIKKKIINKTAADDEQSKEKSKNRSKFSFDFKLINRENINHIFKFIVKMIKILKMDYLILKVAFSLGDPYYNGIFLAYYYSLKEIFDYPDLKAEIKWQEVVFEAEGSAGGKIIPLQIVYHFLKFVFSIKSLKIFWRLYQSNKKG